MRFPKVAAVALLIFAAVQLPAQVFVGSYQVDQGPFWTPAPPVYSALEAAALLFGGAPTDYSISTVDSNPANIDHQGWYSEIFVSGGHLHPENYHNDVGGPGYDTFGDASAFVQDNAVGSDFTNFVFRNSAVVPEASSSLALLLGVGGTGFMCIRRFRRS